MACQPFEASSWNDVETLERAAPILSRKARNMSGSTKFHLSAGDRAPPCLGFTAKGTLYASEAQAGRAVVLILARHLSNPALLPLLTAFSARAGELAAREVDLVALIGEDVEAVFDFNFHHPGKVTLVGSLNDFLERIGFDSETPEVLVIDRNSRVALRIGSGDSESMVAATMSAANGLPAEAPRDICAPAPVLLLTNLLDRDLCQELIEMHKTGPSFESPVLTTDADGKPQHKLDYELKKRRDMLLERDHPMHVRITEIIMRTVVPEIKRVFQVNVNHTDRFLLACYPGDGGHFCRHRDDRPALVAFRRFAVSINLTTSADGYEGGFLRLPEFNLHNYRCPTGAGLIFSVALLHEITPVLRGDRYVLVTHLHDDEGEAQWLAMRQTLAGSVPSGAPVPELAY